MSERPPIPTETVYIDTEYGGLNPSSRIWEIGAILERPGQPDELHVMHVLDFDASTADPASLEFAGFYDRHPMYVEGWHPLTHTPAAPGQDPDRAGGVEYVTAPEHVVARAVERLVRGRRVVACNPAGADVPRLIDMLARHGFLWHAHYKPVCAYDVAFGALGIAPMSIDTGELATRLGITRDRSTAHEGLADCFYARDVLRAALAARQSEPKG